MNRNWLTFCLLAGLALPSRAALQFTNVTAQVKSNSTTIPLIHSIAFNELNSVATDGGDTFVMVGASPDVVIAQFTSNDASGISYTNSTVSFPTGQTKDVLYAAAFGVDRFVIGGTNSLVYYSTTKGSNWLQGTNAFSKETTVRGLAFNTNLSRFAAMASIVTASYGSNALEWGKATIADAFALESFRGVAPLSSNGVSGFLACGVQGVIRESLDGGSSWDLITPWETNSPSLFGVASDGTTNVVVGTNGTIFVLTNGVQLSSNEFVPSDTYYGVVDTGVPGSEFVAVGSSNNGANGLVKISSDAVAWSNSPYSPANPVLTMGFAKSGIMAGVGFAVDIKSDVFLCGTPPPAPSSVTNQTNFAFSLPNPPLSVVFSNDAQHPAGSVTADWYEVNGTNVFLGTNSINPPDNVAFDDNTASNYVYNVVERDLRTGFTNSTPVAVTLSIVPLPKSTIISPASRTNCNDGSSIIVTNTLTGIGPWVIYWSDGKPETNNTAGPGPVANTNGFYPTNALTNPNAADTNNSYSVTDLATFLTNHGTVVTGYAFHTNLLGTNQVTVDPRPTATIVSPNRTNYNDGSPFTIMANLTGTGNWNVTWSDGLVTNYTAIPGNTGMVARVVFPTNALANDYTTNTYSILGVTNVNGCGCNGSLDGCTNFPGDLSGSNYVIVRPRPTSTLVSTNDSPCNYGSNYVIHAQLTGIGPWTVTWWDGAVSNAPATPGATGAVARVVFPTNTLPNSATNYQYWVSQLLDAYDNTNGVIQPITNFPGDLTGTNTVTVNPLPTIQVAMTTNTICANGSYQVTNVLTGLGPWAITWISNDVAMVQNVTNPANNGDGPYTNTYTVFPTNAPSYAVATNQYYVSVLMDTYGCIANSQSGLMGTNVVFVDPVATNPPSSLGDVTNCSDVAVLLSVTVPPGFTADWFAESTLKNRLASSTTNYVPPVPTPLGTSTYYVVARFDDPNLTNTCISPATNVSLVSLMCTNQISSITLSGTNAVIQWSGDYVLLQSSNLAPAYWTVVTQGVAGLNLFTNPVMPPPTNDFFRLFAPTNYPYPTNFGP